MVLPSDGSLVLADADNWRIRGIAPGGAVTNIAGDGSSGARTDGAALSARFWVPKGLGLNPAGSILYIAENSFHTIRTLSPVSASGTVTTYAGNSFSGSADGVGASASFNTPYGVAVAADGTVLVADRSNGRIRKIVPSVANNFVTLGAVSTLAGSSSGALADGFGTSARLNGPCAIVFDPMSSTGLAIVAECDSGAIRTITPAGLVGTLAGVGGPGYVDSLCATSRFNVPLALAVDTRGDIFVADYLNNRIRKIVRATPTPAPAGSVRFAFTALKSTAAASLPALGTGDFTVELWVYLTAAPTNPYATIMAIGGGAGSLNGEIRIEQARSTFSTMGVMLPCASTGSMGTCPCGTITSPGTVNTCSGSVSEQVYLLPSSTLPLNTWLHIALTRRGATHVLYVNGAVVTTVTTSVVYFFPA